MPTFNYEFESLAGWALWVAPNPPHDLVTPELNIEDTRTGAHPLAVHSGSTSVRFVQHWSTWHAGLMRQFPVTPLSLVKLSAWGRIWNVSSGTFPAPSDTNTDPWLRVGIDYTGGVQPTSQSVTWNELKVYDAWKLAEVQAVALANTVTVFVGFENGRTAKWDLQNMYAFLDSVQVIIEGATPPPDPNPLPTPTIGGILTESIEDRGEYFRVVQWWPKGKPG